MYDLQSCFLSQNIMITQNEDESWPASVSGLKISSRSLKDCVFNESSSLGFHLKGHFSYVNILLTSFVQRLSLRFLKDDPAIELLGVNVQEDCFLLWNLWKSVKIDQMNYWTLTSINVDKILASSHDEGLGPALVNIDYVTILYMFLQSKNIWHDGFSENL